MNTGSKFSPPRPPTPIMAKVLPAVPDLSFLEDSVKLSKSLGYDDSPLGVRNHHPTISRLSHELAVKKDFCEKNDNMPSKKQKSPSSIKSKMMSFISDQNNQLISLQKQILNLLEMQKSHSLPCVKVEVSTQTDFIGVKDSSVNTSISWTDLQRSMKRLENVSVQTEAQHLNVTDLNDTISVIDDLQPELSTVSSHKSVHINSSDLPSISEWSDCQSDSNSNGGDNLQIMIERINSILKKDNTVPKDGILNVKEATLKQLNRLGVNFQSPPFDKNTSRLYTPLVHGGMKYMSILTCNSEDHSIDMNSWSIQYCKNSHVETKDSEKIEIRKSEIHKQTASEMTMYGMQPSKLSFASKKYLQKYGLLPAEDNVSTIDSVTLVNTVAKGIVSTTNILDIDQIRKQPKLL